MHFRTAQFQQFPTAGKKKTRRPLGQVPAQPAPPFAHAVRSEPEAREPRRAGAKGCGAENTTTTTTTTTNNNNNNNSNNNNHVYLQLLFVLLVEQRAAGEGLAENG